jgi:hypothetical protein
LRNVLYILGDARSSEPLLPPLPSTGHQTSVVLIQQAVHLSQVPATHVYALADDVATYKATPSFPVISYGGLLRLLFEADNVIVL